MFERGDNFALQEPSLEQVARVARKLHVDVDVLWRAHRWANSWCSCSSDSGSSEVLSGLANVLWTFPILQMFCRCSRKDVASRRIVEHTGAGVGPQNP